MPGSASSSTKQASIAESSHAGRALEKVPLALQEHTTMDGGGSASMGTSVAPPDCRMA
eukprot:CAMPEP_0182840480 /NCGR_PEP_ID=MMETSP0006_2-20121128/24473_2 /TAXON_ID=97485 /ORGANISM="Prymnesium parvum, Strain Texoma1" /LENGTH=57 /DNA_ID=CAMNT_0024969801 /DNA_START=692 /DNA_END=862 /DNA_ORIENTATION=-